MGATSWTEGSQSAATWLEGLPGIGGVEAFAPFGFPIQLDNGASVTDPTATWTENSMSASSWTERSQTATTFTEREA